MRNPSRECLRDKRKVLNNTSQFVNSAYTGLDTEKGGKRINPRGYGRDGATRFTHFLTETRLGS